MTWSAPKTFVSGEVLPADELNAYLRDNLIELAASKATTLGSTFVTTDTNVITERFPTESYVEEGASITSGSNTAYVDVQQYGPEVTVETGSCALVWLFSYMVNDNALAICTSYDVSGATTIASIDQRAIIMSQSRGHRVSGVFFHNDLNPGVNTFTAKYRINATAGTTGSWAGRRLTVWPF